MFDREGFVDYVGEKSGNSYASGLGRIEQLYSVEIDVEYDRDQCAALLAQIEQDKRRTDLDSKELKKRSDAASHLKRYIAFKMNSVDTFTDRIRFVIGHYKAHFAAIDPEERYKWEAIGWFQKHWNIEADDFAGMLANSFSKASVLLASSMYYPYRVITEYAQADPGEVHRIFRILYDEELPLTERYQAFRDSCKGWADRLTETMPGQKKTRNHYQDLRAVMVYLTFRYPEKYYLYKSTMYADFRDRIGFREEQSNQSSVIGKVENYFRMCDMILEEVKQDAELLAMHQARLDNTCYQDEALHLLTMDIVYYGGVYMSEEDFRKRPIVKPETAYWPSLEEYDPGITTEMWVAALNDPAVTSPENLDMLRKMLALGGESTCAHLAEVYGNTAAYYNKLGSSFGGKVKKYFHCPDCPGRETDTTERNRVYVVPFVGRYVSENGNKRYVWKLRDELKEGLMRMDIPDPIAESATDVGLNTILYGPPGTGKTYHTILYAVAILENKALAAVEKEDYAEVRKRYNDYQAQGRVEFTTFHQSYGYEEFIEGIKPVVASDDAEGEAGNIRYSVEPGVFKRFCEKADSKRSGGENYVFIIDEINRGNISKIFGELITLIEETKRLGQREEMTVRLPYSQKLFGVPKNVYILGTMNTADRSIAAIDTALRRRFLFREMLPAPEVLADISVEDLSICEMLTRLNKRITALYDREHTIGHGYFMPLKASPTIETLAKIFANNIIPLLQEYFYEDYEKIRLVLGDNRKSNPAEQFIIARQNDYTELFGDTDVGLDDGYSYEINDAAFQKIEAYGSI